MFEIKNITMIYDMEKAEKVYALGGFDLTLPDKGLIGIIGPSGSGKSTLMYCLSTLKKPTDGQILYNGKNLTSLKDSERENLRRNEFGFVFQRHFLVPYMSAVDNVTVAAAKNDKETTEQAKRLLSGFGLGEKEWNKRPAKLSGGQRQRTAIARAMINQPKVLFADEPTAALDHENAFAVMEILKDYAKKHLVLIITHDRSILKDADRIIELWDGNISAIKGGDTV
ncbi:MAG: ABC transporter ATP-binding protein [Lachnospiraceae bacterium]|nr:ABC transporter ATP-binding protein [Lachnospiraceae bacterium]MBP3609758.1 ABC transporter ATP-binding protein [Lachnospiraceae bacterium]